MSHVNRFWSGFYRRTGVPLPEKKVMDVEKRYRGSLDIALSVYFLGGMNCQPLNPDNVADELCRRAEHLDLS